VIVLSVVTLGALMTGLAYVLYFRLIADAGATSASMVTYLIPPVAVLLGAVLRDEPLGWNLLAGALVVLLGVALAEGRLRTVAGFRHLSPRTRSGAFPG
jgi:drug/metabolite transporter (DMT)-like permease